MTISESLAQDIRENLIVLVSIDGIDGALYSRQVAYYRDVAALLACGDEIEQLIAAVAAEALLGPSLTHEHRQWLAG